MTDAAAPRSEHLLRLHRTGPGKFVCDQRPVGGKLWMVRREGRRGWWVKAHHEPADTAVVLPLGELRAFLAERARELSEAAQTVDHRVLCCRCSTMRPAELMVDLPEGYVCSSCVEPANG